MNDILCNVEEVVKASVRDARVAYNALATNLLAKDEKILMLEDRVLQLESELERLGITLLSDD